MYIKVEIIKETVHDGERMVHVMGPNGISGAVRPSDVIAHINETEYQPVTLNSAVDSAAPKPRGRRPAK